MIVKLEPGDFLNTLYLCPLLITPLLVSDKFEHKHEDQNEDNDKEEVRGAP